MRVWIVASAFLAVLLSPMLTHQASLESEYDVHYTSPIQTSISPSSGWNSGGEEITISGTGFSDLAFSNITDDGINHQWVETTMAVSYTHLTLPTIA